MARIETAAGALLAASALLVSAPAYAQSPASPGFTNFHAAAADQYGGGGGGGGGGSGGGGTGGGGNGSLNAGVTVSGGGAKVVIHVCASRRFINVHLPRLSPGETFRSGKAYVDSPRPRVLHHGQRFVRLDFRGFKGKRAFPVKIYLHTNRGVLFRRLTVFHTCTARRAGSARTRSFFAVGRADLNRGAIGFRRRGARAGGLGAGGAHGALSRGGTSVKSNRASYQTATLGGGGNTLIMVLIAVVAAVSFGFVIRRTLRRRGPTAR